MESTETLRLGFRAFALGTFFVGAGAIDQRAAPYERHFVFPYPDRNVHATAIKDHYLIGGRHVLVFVYVFVYVCTVYCFG